jgi:hypothetical protein
MIAKVSFSHSVLDGGGSFWDGKVSLSTFATTINNNGS